MRVAFYGISQIDLISGEIANEARIKVSYHICEEVLVIELRAREGETQ